MNTDEHNNRYSNYTKKIPVDENYYDDIIFEKIPDNTIVGKYIDFSENVGRYHQNLYHIDTDRNDKKITKVFGYASLDRQMKEVNIGDILEIKYVRYNTDKNYHEFKVSKLYY